MAIREGWKVLAKRRWSAWITGRGTGGAIQYPARKWVKPRRGCGPLAVFDNEDSAKDFADYWGGTVHSCQFKSSRSQFLWTVRQPKPEKPLFYPSGTCFATAVKCLN
jgi:hypothetical protein